MNVMKDSTDNLLSGTDNTNKPARSTGIAAKKSRPKKRPYINRTKNNTANTAVSSKQNKRTTTNKKELGDKR